MVSKRQGYAVEKTAAYDLDNAYIVYDPDDSMDLVFTSIYAATGTARPHDAFTWVEKLALSCNDALNKHYAELGVDGFFFVSRSGTQTAVPAAGSLKYKIGPALYFAQFTRSEEARREWRDSSFIGKVHLQSLYFKHQSLADNHPTLPIWTTYPYVAPNGQTFSDHIDGGAKSLMVTTHFPTEKAVKESGAQDPTIDPTSKKVRGPLVDIIERKIMVASANEYRSRCHNQSEKGVMVMYYVSSSSVTKAGQWARSKKLKDDDGEDGEDGEDGDDGDQIQPFIRKIRDWMNERPQDMIEYRYARSWAPLPIYFEKVKQKDSYIKEVDETAARWSHNAPRQDDANS